MTATPVKIALLYDTSNRAYADTLIRLFRHTSYTQHGIRRLIFDAARPERTTRALERYDIILAAIGVPERQDYQETIDPFMTAYAAAIRKPAVGIISHAPNSTQMNIERWINAA
jgi:hypothetical protein